MYLNSQNMFLKYIERYVKLDYVTLDFGNKLKNIFFTVLNKFISSLYCVLIVHSNVISMILERHKYLVVKPSGMDGSRQVKTFGIRRISRAHVK